MNAFMTTIQLLTNLRGTLYNPTRGRYKGDHESAGTHPPSDSDMMPLPAPAQDQAFCVVSAIEAGLVSLPLDYIIDTAQPGERTTLPSLSFLPYLS